MTQLPTSYQRYIHASRYARFIDEKARRETWEETVLRYCNYWHDKYPDLFPYQEALEAITKLEVMPSMRALMTAGKALDRDNIAGYNCSYTPIRYQRAFDDIMYILLCGTGVGFSVERQDICHLPLVAEEFHSTDTTIVVQDSKMGWATALRELISLLYAGKVPKWDLSRIRPAGSRLKIFGGRASGPEPLNKLFRAISTIFQQAAGRRLNSLELHDIVCHIAGAVVVGGVRRSALISLSNLTDERMQRAKMGDFGTLNPQRYLANNSTAYTEKPDVGIFLKEWTALYDSKSGERGIFNRMGAKSTAGTNGRRDTQYEFGTNPCGEIILRPNGLCNLSEVICRADDDFESLKRKVQLATILGTFQSTLTNFRYVSKEWRKNAEEERLLGVSLTGIMDLDFLKPANANSFVLAQLRDHAISTNKEWAGRLGINVSAAITTVKPSGTVSQLVNSASGIHPRWSEYYIRSVRADRKDPITQYMIDKGVPHEPDVTNGTNMVFYFPERSPEGCVTRKDVSALEQLEHYLKFKQHWCEHNPSITVYVRENEWLKVGAWVYEHFNDIGGISFLPFSDHIYEQAPYKEITKDEYERAIADFPKLDFSEVVETTDETTGSQELACMSGQCEIV